MINGAWDPKGGDQLTGKPLPRRTDIIGIKIVIC